MPDHKTTRFQERWFALANPSIGRTVLLLDASDASTSVAAGMLRFATDVVKKFHSVLDTQTYFLGNSTPYPVDDFLQKSGDWHRANAGRLALIGPVLEAVGVGSNVEFLILAAGRIFDCDDWPPEARLSQRTTIIGFGETPRVPIGFGKQIPCDLDRVRECIDQRVASVAIMGDGCFPFFWSNPDYRWERNRLLADKANDFSVSLGLSIPPGSKVEAVVTLSNGEQTNRPLEPTDPYDQSDWTPLPDVEARIVRECVANAKYTCPFCKETHDSRTLICRSKQQGSLLGHSVLPALEGFKGGGFILFDIRKTIVKFRLHNCLHLRCPPKSVAIARHGTANADVWNLSESNQHWEKNGERWKQFTQVGDNVHAIVL